LFISTAIAWSPVGLELSFAGLEVQSFPVLGSKYKFSLLYKLLSILIRSVSNLHDVLEIQGVGSIYSSVYSAFA